MLKRLVSCEAGWRAVSAKGRSGGRKSPAQDRAMMGHDTKLASFPAAYSCFCPHGNVQREGASARSAPFPQLHMPS